MDNDAKPKTRVKHPDRVTLSAEAQSRISNWMTSVQERLKGNRINKSDLVNFLVISHSSDLAEEELDGLRSQYFDEVQFAEWALRQIKEMKALGKTVSLAEIVGKEQL